MFLFFRLCDHRSDKRRNVLPRLLCRIILPSLFHIFSDFCPHSPFLHSFFSSFVPDSLPTLALFFPQVIPILLTFNIIPTHDQFTKISFYYRITTWTKSMNYSPIVHLLQHYQTQGLHRVQGLSFFFAILILTAILYTSTAAIAFPLYKIRPVHMDPLGNPISKRLFKTTRPTHFVFSCMDNRIPSPATILSERGQFRS